MSLNTLLSLLSWLVTGAVAGYIASVLLRTERMGCFINIGLGIVGAFVGGFLINTFLPGLARIFGTGTVAGVCNSIFHATVGAVVILIIVELVLPGQQLGVRKDRKK